MPGNSYRNSPAVEWKSLSKTGMSSGVVRDSSCPGKQALLFITKVMNSTFFENRPETI